MIYPIPPNLYCVPSALVALTGADPASVIIPAINRHEGNPTLLGNVVGVHLNTMTAVLSELGYAARRYRKPDQRARLATWAARSLKYPGRALLAVTATHALVIQDGTVYDNHTPKGCPGARHPFRNSIVTDLLLVEKRT